MQAKGDADKQLWEGITAFMMMIFAMPFTLSLRAYILAKLWVWFVVSAFPSAPVLTFGQAFGIWLIAHFLQLRRSKTNDEPPTVADAMSTIAFMGVVAPLMCLGIGYIAYRLLVKP